MGCLFLSPLMFSFFFFFSPTPSTLVPAGNEKESAEEFLFYFPALPSLAPFGGFRRLLEDRSEAPKIGWREYGESPKMAGGPGSWVC